MRVIKDTIKYLEYIKKLSKSLPPDKKEQLENILSAQLTLLILLKKGSNLGTYKFSWED